MGSEVRTCPNCGALITAQLARCRQCKTYLHGTKLEGMLFEHLLPERFRDAPGTALILLLIFGYYILMAVFAKNPLSFSVFSLQQLGATFGPAFWQGQYWRFVTANFVHHDAMHIAFNVSALVVLGPLVEQAFDKKKMLFIYVLSGVASMMVSHAYYTEISSFIPFSGGGAFTTSGGASGAVCGLLGATWYAAHKKGPAAKEVAARMKQWAIIILVIGFILPVNNAAHLGGGLAGALLARLIPMGLTQSVSSQRIMSVVMLAMLGIILGSTGLMLHNLRGYPGTLERDYYPNTFWGITIEEGHPWEYSSQNLSAQSCDDAARASSHDPEAIQKCEFNIRAVPQDPTAYARLAIVLRKAGDVERAALMEGVGNRVERTILGRLLP